MFLLNYVCKSTLANYILLHTYKHASFNFDVRRLYSLLFHHSKWTNLESIQRILFDPDWLRAVAERAPLPT